MAVTDEARNRIGRFYWGAGPSEFKFILAATDVPIAKQYKLPALPPSYDPREFTVTEPTNEAVRRWKHDRVDGGEGQIIFDATQNLYRISDGAIPNLDDNTGGITLGPYSIGPTQRSVGGNFVDGGYLGFAQAQLWTGEDDNAYPWRPVQEDWDAGISTGASATQVIFSFADVGDTFVYTSHSNGDVRKWKSGSSSIHVTAATFANANSVVLIPWGDRLFALDENDLVEIDLSTTNTITTVADVESNSTVSEDDVGRATAGDVGPIWVQRLKTTGEIRIWQYNVASATRELLSHGDIPRNSDIHSVHYAHGFIWVGYSAASRNHAEGSSFIYYQRGSQRGSLGPVRPMLSTAAGILVIAGFIGDDLMFAYQQAVWAYNARKGAINMLRIMRTDDNFTDAKVYNDGIFVSGHIGATFKTVEQLQVDNYMVDDTGELFFGRYDLGWPGLQKVLLDVTVITDPLPANCSVKIYYAVDGGAATLATGNHTGTGATTTTFTISTPTTIVAGQIFELGAQLDGDNNDESVTPVVREVIGRAMIDETEKTYDISIDLGKRRVAGYDQDEDQILEGLSTLAEQSGFVNFENPFQVRSHEAPSVEVVKIISVGQPEISDEGIRYCTLQAKVVPQQGGGG